MRREKVRKCWGWACRLAWGVLERKVDFVDGKLTIPYPPILLQPPLALPVLISPRGLPTQYVQRATLLVSRPTSVVTGLRIGSGVRSLKPVADPHRSVKRRVLA